MGGEKPLVFSRFYYLMGSPPHGRGKALEPANQDGKEGITPAWAGKRGKIVIAKLILHGSPPHGRGKVPLQKEGLDADRITPAWAGKRAVKHFIQQRHRDHPRMGGEKKAERRSFCNSGGSPPHGRGKVISSCELNIWVGITPAWAGKSRHRRRQQDWPRDHPRVGGEKGKLTQGTWERTGSPPRGRGKASFSGNSRPGVGITPAWAGKRRQLWRLSMSWQDHPRVGGEKKWWIRRAWSTLGSPPRGRGKVKANPIGLVVSGITPAWAGKRLKRSHRSGIFISGPIPFHSVLHRPAGSGSSRAGRDGSPAGQPQNAGPA